MSTTYNEATVIYGTPRIRYDGRYVIVTATRPQKPRRNRKTAFSR